MNRREKLAILGSTGSIGTQTLEIAERYNDRFEVYTLTANDNWELLVSQALKFMPDSVVIANELHYMKVKEALYDTDVKVYAGRDALEQICSSTEIDTVVSALVGFAGLFPTACAVENRKKIALANKETLVVAGEYIMSLADKRNTPILPVDSEHSAIFQSLVGEHSPIEKIILTASGGPFLNFSKEELCSVTAAQALKHPNWNMGRKITIDSATLMNKGFEVIEAKWLFGVKPEQIEVVVHPSSIIHSMVQFEDGAIKAQMGLPDMKLPIQYALTFPERLPIKNERFCFNNGASFEFFEPDKKRFPCLDIAYEAMRRGGNVPCIVNAANEVAVGLFLEGKIGFYDIYRIIENCISAIDFISSPSLNDYRECDKTVREYALSIL